MQQAKREFAAFASVPVTSTFTSTPTLYNATEEGMRRNRCLCVTMTVLLSLSGAAVGLWYAAAQAW